MSETRLLRLGSINGGTVPVVANVAYLGPLAPIAVTFSTDYALENPGTGFPVPALPDRAHSATLVPLHRRER